MLCEKCHKQEASVFYEETVGNKTRSFSLCTDCAKELQHMGENELLFALPSAWPFSDGLFGSLFGAQSTAQKAEKTCPVCHATFRSFTSDGKVGCPTCYHTFADELRETIRSIHGNVSHIGRAPAQYRKKSQNQKQLAALREALKTAIAEENFESAATLRDQIKALESEGKEN